MKSNDQLLYCLKRGLSGYISYLAACQMNDAFSEYVLYEPILRILTALNCHARCEVECDGLHNGVQGDKKRIDFVVSRCELEFAIEVKWAKQVSLDVTRDHEKLKWFTSSRPGSDGYLCIFGRKKVIEQIRLRPATFKEIGKPLFAEFGKTRYGCRIYTITNSRTRASTLTRSPGRASRR